MAFLTWLGGLVAKWGLDKLYTKAGELLRKLLRNRSIDKDVDKDTSAEMDIVKQLNEIDFEENELLSEGKELPEEKKILRKKLEEQLREVSSKNDSDFYG